MSEEHKVEELCNALHRCLQAMKEAGMQGRSCYDDGIAVLDEVREFDGVLVARDSGVTVDVSTESLKEIVDSVSGILPMAEALNSFVANNDVWVENRKKISRATLAVSGVASLLSERK